MKIFIDTANISEVEQATALGMVEGVTTNPSLIAKEGLDVKEVITQIAGINFGPVSAEVISLDFENMLKEGQELAKLAPNIVVKIPMTADGLKATAEFKKLGIKTNVTLIFSTNQALLAARAGATYVSPFVGRLDDIDFDGISLVKEIACLFKLHNIDTKIIAASIRHSLHVSQAALAGADIATIPYKVILDIIKHPLTASGIEKFLADWQQAKK